MIESHPKPPFDDEYTGPRWTYGLSLRPFSGAGVPKGFIVFSHRDHPRFRHGTIQFPFELTDFQIRQMDLTPCD